jgi:hypothetical protein
MKSLRQAFAIVKPPEPVLSVRGWGDLLLGEVLPISLKQLIEQATLDSDTDGLPDFWEQLLAERFAPILYHSSDESNFPTNVDWFLPNTELWFYDDACTPDLDKLIIRSPTQAQLLEHQYTGGCGSSDTVYSAGTRSIKKQRTFYLKDVAEAFRKGSLDSRDWVTYYHAYPNDQRGITIQYWRFYAHNDAANNHGGDWEGFHLVLNQDLQPASIGLLGHTDISYLPPNQFEWEGNHVRIYSEGGGHASRASGSGINAQGGSGVIDPAIPSTCVRQETWTGGQVHWFDGTISATGSLINLGAKTAPMNGQVFIQYSGIWGSPGTVDFTSGYWGPAFNETGMREDGFITAWGAGMVGDADLIRRECYPTATSR